VKVKEDGNLSIHDQLRDMGRKFAIQEEKNRIWDPETNLQILHEQKVIITTSNYLSFFQSIIQK
jgi:IS4 transposase